VTEIFKTTMVASFGETLLFKLLPISKTIHQPFQPQFDINPVAIFNLSEW